jgi:prepilin-type N-terminal cleavage/methylation domain-containing protein
MMQLHFSKRHRLGFTLVELLVALAVITVLASIALPATKSMLKEQRLSRSASMLQSAIQEARARAVADGGGGLIIDRRGTGSITDRCEANQVRFASTPPAYKGEPGAEQPFFGNFGGLVPPELPPGSLVTLWFPPEAATVERSSTDLSNGKPFSMVNVGDTVSIGDVKLPMQIYGINSLPNPPTLPSANPTLAQRNSDGLTNVLIPDTDVTTWNRVILRIPEANQSFSRLLGKRVRFSIQRSPQPAIAQPITMPNGTSIDLTSSGVGSGEHQFSPFAIEENYRDTAMPPFGNADRSYGPIYILFNSRGELSRVIASKLSPSGLRPDDIPVTGDVFLLVGEAGQVKAAPDEQLEDQDPSPLTDKAKDGTTPLLNPESVWVTLRSRSGDVISSPWTNPTTRNDTFVMPRTTTSSDPMVDQNTEQARRIRAALTLTRSAAVQMQEVSGR